MKVSILRNKTYAFALKVMKTYKSIVSEHKEIVLYKQFLKAGTAIGALVYEAEFAQSKPDFISKLSMALKESNETTYWISLLRDSDYLIPTTSTELLNENIELKRMLIASINTAKNK